MDTVAGDDIDKLLEDRMHKSERRSKRKRHFGSRSRSRSRKRRSRRKRSRSRSASSDYEERRNKRRQEIYDRDECTIFACHIHPAVDDKDVFEFFSQCGKVRDIILMRDPQSGTSKGYCYIEFLDKESVVSALTINGQYLGGYPVMVSVSNAEKNRTAASATSAVGMEGPFKLYVANISEEIGADDLEPIFSAFGTIEGIYVDKKADPTTKTKSGYVEFRSNSEATFALTNLNNMTLLGKNLRISQTNISGSNHPTGSIPGLSSTRLDEGQGGLQLNANSRVMLMQRLQASAKATEEEKKVNEAVEGGELPVNRRIQSRYVLLKNLFDPDEETEENWDKDIKDDVATECSKFGEVESCIVDKSSLGHVYLIFKDNSGANDATNQLNGRWFSQKQIVAEMIDFDTYQQLCPKYK